MIYTQFSDVKSNIKVKEKRTTTANLYVWRGTNLNLKTKEEIVAQNKGEGGKRKEVREIDDVESHDKLESLGNDQN